MTEIAVDTVQYLVTVDQSGVSETVEVAFAGYKGPKGDPGPQGPPGENAQDPNFTVSTGAPGTDVEISGIYPNQNLQIPRGNVGATGPQGPQGIQGNPGTDAQDPNFTVSTGAPGTNVEISGIYPNQNLQIPRGNVGATGATGPQGPKGDPGTDAQDPNFTVSTGAPGTDVILSGTYPNQNIQIPRGNAGTNGTNGTDGKSVLNGSGAPSGGLGVDGDFYIDTTADAIYGPKTAGAWGSPTSLIGPTGATGPQGPQGIPGENGTVDYSLTVINALIYG